MARHTDFGRIGRGDQAATRRRRDARAALFTDSAETPPATEDVDAAPTPRLAPVDPAAPEPASAPAQDAQPEPPAGALDAGWFVLECSACRTRTRMGLLSLMFAAMPSVHVPFLRPDYPSLMRCPYCHAYHWVKVRLDLDL